MTPAHDIRTAPILAGRKVEGPASARLMIDGEPHINFYGCGYLALTALPQVRAAVFEALAGGASFAQHLPAALGATDPIFTAVEREAAALLGTEASLYLASGYLIGMVALVTLEGRADLILIDELAHHNLRDAAALSGLPVHSFRHRDSQSAADVLARTVAPGQRPALLTDGMFPTTGDLAPLRDYDALLARYGGLLLVDESHAIGVLGPDGQGAGELLGIARPAGLGATLSKALCAQGAVVGCTREQSERLRQVPPVRGANAGSPLSAVAAAACIVHARAHPEYRDLIATRADQLRSRLRAIGIEPTGGPGPIVAFRAGERQDMLALQRRALAQGIYIFHSDYIGAGPEGIIRCAIFRDHSSEDIDALISAIS